MSLSRLSAEPRLPIVGLRNFTSMDTLPYSTLLTPEKLEDLEFSVRNCNLWRIFKTFKKRRKVWVIMKFWMLPTTSGCNRQLRTSKHSGFDTTSPRRTLYYIHNPPNEIGIVAAPLLHPIARLFYRTLPRDRHRFIYIWFCSSLIR